MARPMPSPLPSPRYSPYTPPASSPSKGGGGYFHSFHGPSSALASPGRAAKPRSNTAPPTLFACPYQGCTSAFARDEHLTRHERTHSQEKPFQCTLRECGKNFSRLDNVRQHIKTQHKEDMYTTETAIMMRHLGVLQKQLSADAAARRRERLSGSPESIQLKLPTDVPDLDRSQGSSSSDASSPASPPNLPQPPRRTQTAPAAVVTPTHSPVPATYSSQFQLGARRFASATAARVESPLAHPPYSSPAPSGHLPTTQYPILPPMPRKRSLPTMPEHNDWASVQAVMYPGTAPTTPANEYGNGSDTSRSTTPAVAPTYQLYAASPTMGGAPAFEQYQNAVAGQGGLLAPAYLRPSGLPSPMLYPPPPPLTSYPHLPPPIMPRRPSVTSTLSDYALAPMVDADPGPTGGVVTRGLTGAFDAATLSASPSPVIPPADPRSTPRYLPSHLSFGASSFSPWAGHGTTPLSSPLLNSDAFPSPFLQSSSTFASTPRNDYVGLAGFQG